MKNASAVDINHIPAVRNHTRIGIGLIPVNIIDINGRCMPVNNNFWRIVVPGLRAVPYVDFMLQALILFAVGISGVHNPVGDFLSPFCCNGNTDIKRKRFKTFHDFLKIFRTEIFLSNNLRIPVGIQSPVKIKIVRRLPEYIFSLQPDHIILHPVNGHLFMIASDRAEFSVFRNIFLNPQIGLPNLLSAVDKISDKNKLRVRIL